MHNDNTVNVYELFQRSSLESHLQTLSDRELKSVVRSTRCFVKKSAPRSAVEAAILDHVARRVGKGREIATYVDAPPLLARSA